MLTDLAIENYQAVRKARLVLGRLTVITGPTGSGKSAVIRAMRLAAFNARGTSYVKHGAKSCKVCIGDREQGWAVAVERGGRGKDAYRLAFRPQGGDAPHAEEFTKLAGAVPEEIRNALRLTPLNFAGQFDRPYLLDESGGQVARVLGELTNVTLLFEAAREAERRRRGIVQDLGHAEARVAELIEQARAFRRLRDRRQAAEQAGRCLQLALNYRQKLDRLKQVSGDVDQAEAVAELHARRLASWQELPGPDALDSSSTRAGRLRGLYALLRETQQSATREEESARAAAREEELAHEDLHRALVRAGVCPTCGQGVAG